MSWACIPYTCFVEQEVGSCQTCFLGTLQSLLAKLKNIPVEFYYKGNLTEFYRYFPFGTILGHSESITQNAQKRSKCGRRYLRNSSSPAGSLSPAKTSAVPAKAKVSTGLGRGFGAKWRELSVRYDPVSSSWKTHRCLWEEVLPESSVTLPRAGMIVDGVCWELTMLELPKHASACGWWPTPVRSDAKCRRKNRYSQGGNPLSYVIGGWWSPTWIEWLMGFPISWSGMSALPMPKFRSWLQQHGGF
jgi:hypothetical protein